MKPGRKKYQRLDMQETLIIIAWAAVALISAIRLPRSSLSRYELRRRAAAGDRRAISQRRYEQERPLVSALVRAAAVALAVMAVAVTVGRYGVVGGALIAVVAAFFVQFVGRIGSLRRMMNRLEQRYHARLAAASRRLRPLLRFFIEDEDRPALPQIDSREELETVLEASHLLTPAEKTRLVLGLAFSTQTVADCMTPLSDMPCVKEDDTVGPLLLDTLHKTGRRVFPVVRGKSKVVGSLVMSDIVNLKQDTAVAAALMRPDVAYITADTTLEQALGRFLQADHRLFIVVNDANETIGCLIFEAVMERLLGPSTEKPPDEPAVAHDSHA